MDFGFQFFVGRLQFCCSLLYPQLQFVARPTDFLRFSIRASRKIKRNEKQQANYRSHGERHFKQCGPDFAEQPELWPDTNAPCGPWKVEFSILSPVLLILNAASGHSVDLLVALKNNGRVERFRLVCQDAFEVFPLIKNTDQESKEVFTSVHRYNYLASNFPVPETEGRGEHCIFSAAIHQPFQEAL